MMTLLLIAIPLAAGLVCCLLDDERRKTTLIVGGVGAASTFALSAVMAFRLEPELLAGRPPAWLGVDWQWVGSLGLRFSCRPDGLSLPLVLGGAAVFLAAMLSEASRSEKGGKKVVAGLLIAESGALTALLAQDLLLFVWGWLVSWVAVTVAGATLVDTKKGMAAVRRTGIHLGVATALVFGGMVVLAAAHHEATGGWSFSLDRLFSVDVTTGYGVWAFGLLLAGLGAGAALFPFHTWLPGISARTPIPLAAPLAVAITKAPLLVWAKVLLGLLPAVGTDYAWLLVVLAVVGVGHSGLLAWTHRDDMRRVQADLVPAFHSLALVGFLSFDIRGVSGAVLLLTAHGLGSSAIYLSVAGMERSVVLGKRPLETDGQRPCLWLTVAALLGVATLTAVPLFPGFVGEVLVWMGAFDSYVTHLAVEQSLGVAPLLLPNAKLWVLVAIVLALLVPAALAVAFYRAFVQEPLSERTYREIPISSPHIWGLALMVGAALLLGLFPNLVLQRAEPGSKALISQGRRAMTARARNGGAGDKQQTESSGSGSPAGRAE
jgi:NADH-quinone oxidoreductase subunit M